MHEGSSFQGFTPTSVLALLSHDAEYVERVFWLSGGEG